jgi:hypothetical protein
MTTIGRRADVRLDTQSGHEISKIHTVIYRRSRDKSETWVIEDNRSVNGTFVNSIKIHRKILIPGDEIVFGGGPNFRMGDILESTEKSSCRYRFLLPAPTVKFVSQLDPNQSLALNDSSDFCAICYQPIVSTQDLPCGHKFCLECIQEWVDTSKKAGRAAVCPMCRTPFLHSQLMPSEAVMHDGTLEVWCVGGILHELNVTNCRVIRGVNIFKKWTRKHRKWFWKALAQVDEVPARRIIFLHLTKATISHVLGASEDELKQGLDNFGVTTVDDDPAENRRKLILRMTSVIGKSE